MDQSFSERQASNARLRQEMLEQKQAAESAKAAAYLKRFVSAAKATGMEPVPLVVRGYGGKGSAKTPLKGWYLKNDHSLAVDEDGNYYVLNEQLSLKDRIKGLTPKPKPPPLILGAGGRDGESMDLTEKLTELLPSWQQTGK